MSEYIGSRISLISKSDIKYIGTLHEINSDNHTVALESVTSHGTEGRKGNPAEEVPGSDQVYEYIVFRGSDVKDLTIIENASQKENQAPQVPNDPAILGSQRPPQPPQQTPQQPPPPQHQQPQQFGYQGPPQPPRFQGPGGPHGFPGTPGAVPGYGFPPPGPHGPPPQGFGMGYGPPPGHGFPPHVPPPGPFGPNQHMQGPPGQMNRPPQHMQRSPQPPIGSKEGTPQPQDQPQPPPQQPPNQQRAFEMSATPGPGPNSSAGPPPPVASKPPVTAATAPSAPAQAQQAKATPKTNNRVAVPLPGARPPQKPTTAAQVAGGAPPQAAAPPPPQSIDDATQAATAAVAAAMAKLGPVNQQSQQNATDNLTQKVAQMRMNDNQQRGRGRGRANYPRGGRRESAQKQIEVPKEDYDFETANAKFNKQDLVKEAIASGSPVASPNGEAKDPLSNGDANGHAEEDVVIPPPAAAKSGEKGYDKKSSFFDNISSDLKDREAAAQGGVDRRQERSKNFETFGQGSVDGGRGGYRGRGRGYRGNGQRGFRGRGRGFAPYA